MRTRSAFHLGAAAGAVALLAMLLVAPIASASSGKAPALIGSPLSGGVIWAQAVHAGDVTPVAGTGGAGNSVSPSVSVLPNVQASSGNQPVNEVPITADPNNASHLLSGGNDYNCPTIQGFFASSDGGATWTGHCLRTVGGLLGFGDPTVGYDTSGNAYIAGIDANGSVLNGKIVFEKSADNGMTWSLPRVAASALFSGGLTDKEWMEIDHGASSPRPGAIYISITQFDSTFTHDAISVAHSYDGGMTWSDVQVGPTVALGTRVDQFSDLAVGSDGTVYLSWMRCSPTGPTGDCGGSGAIMLFSKSSDGGVTWTPPSTAASGITLVPDTCGAFYGCLPGTNERMSNIPAIDIDQSSGALYIGYYTWTGSIMQYQVIKSTNGGGTWGAPVMVVPTLNHDQFLSYLSVSPGGKVGASMLVRTMGSKYIAFAAVSTDGGVTFGSRMKIATVKSNVLNDGFGGSFLGDYTGSIFTGETLHVSWPDTRTGTAADETGGLIP